jgi:hypothetical protein
MHYAGPATGFLTEQEAFECAAKRIQEKLRAEMVANPSWVTSTTKLANNVTACIRYAHTDAKQVLPIIQTDLSHLTAKVRRNKASYKVRIGDDSTWRQVYVDDQGAGLLYYIRVQTPYGNYASIYINLKTIGDS